MDELAEQFLLEGRELVQQATEDLLALERAPGDAARLGEVFRAVHTLKGSVGLFDLVPMGRVLHAAEDELEALRAGTRQADAGCLGALLACLGACGRWLEDFAAAGTLPPGADLAAALCQASRVAD